jgi:hypothetical protein
MLRNKDIIASLYDLKGQLSRLAKFKGISLVRTAEISSLSKLAAIADFFFQFELVALTDLSLE